MTTREAIKLLGGHDTLYAIAERLLYARMAHPGFAGDMDEAVGVSVGKARDAVRAALRKGECRASRKTIVAMDGRVTSVPSYVFEGVAP